MQTLIVDVKRQKIKMASGKNGLLIEVAPDLIPTGKYRLIIDSRYMGIYIRVKKNKAFYYKGRFFKFKGSGLYKLEILNATKSIPTIKNGRVVELVFVNEEPYFKIS